MAVAAELSVTMHDGRVTVIAKNVSLRQILAEWSKVGQTKVVGAERLAGPPLTLQLENVPERQALETILRSASGYMAAPRATMMADASIYDRILILPTSNAPASVNTGPVLGQTRTFMPRRGMPAQVPDEAVSDEPPNEDSDVPADLTEAQRRGEDVNDAVETAPPETNFDYANPQLMLQRRQQQQQGQASPTSAATPGTVVQPPAQAPNVFPGTVTPQQAPQPAPTSSRPGEVVQQPQAQPMNPYGLPAGVQPGSVQGGVVQPDRAKYMNPYQPQPPKNPQD